VTAQQTASVARRWQSIYDLKGLDSTNGLAIHRLYSIKSIANHEPPQGYH
jgi:hypothetical protein